MTKFNNSFSDIDKINYLLLNFQPEFFSRKQFIHHVYTKIWRRSRFSKPFVRYYAGQYWDNCPDGGRYAQAILSEDLELCL